MLLGDKIRSLRELQSLSQGDIEARSGLRRCYISRVENCHTVPSIETLERIANAIQIPLYQLFWEESKPQPKLTKSTSANCLGDWASQGTGAIAFRKLRSNLSKMDNRHRALLLLAARWLARKAGARQTANPDQPA